MRQITFEEINLICCYARMTKADTVAAITTALPHMDKDIQDIAKKAILKLESYQDINIQQLLICKATDNNP